MKHRLVVCDVDGTLLQKNESVVSYNIINEIKRLVDSGVLFCVASGRSFAELEKLFCDLKDDIYFVCLDGAVALKNNEIVFMNPLDENRIKKVFEYADFKNKASFVLYGSRMNYAISEDEEFLSYINSAFNGKLSVVNSYDEINEEIYKISVCGNLFDKMQRFNSLVTSNRLLKKIYDDDVWHDYIGVNTDKKNAVEFIQKLNNIKYEETAVFGDNTNDMGLLRCGLSSFAMKQGSLEIKRIAKYETDSVLSELKKI